MPSCSVTVTGKVGAGDTVTSQLLQNVTGVHFDIAGNVITIDQTPDKHFQVDYDDIATVTVTIVGTVGLTKSTTMTIST